MMYQGRAGRDYITRSHPDNRGREIGTVEKTANGEIFVEVTAPVGVPGSSKAIRFE